MPDYETLDNLLIMVNTPFSPAYIHGMMMGLLSIKQPPYSQSWEQLQQEIPFLQEKKHIAYKSFNTLFNLTASSLDQNTGRIELMLPDIDEPLSIRLKALGEWCEGYLVGIKITGIPFEELLEIPIVKEVLTDLVQIQELSPLALGSEENEKNYVELVEFVNVSVLLIHTQYASTLSKKIGFRSEQIH
ncbi:MAG: UPF0149 family protein [Candidatus Berkiellales bacterium]